MARTIPAAYNTELTSATVRVAYLAELFFDGGTTRLWTGVGNLTWNTFTWDGVGTFGGIADVKEPTGTEAAGITLQLSGIPSAMLSLALSDEYQGKQAKVYQALFDASDVIIVDPVLVFSGRMDVMQITDSGETGIIQMSCESRSIDIDRKRVLRYTHEEQERLFTGDLGLQYVASMQDKPIYWGSFPPPSVPGGGGSPGGGLFNPDYGDGADEFGIAYP